MIIIEEYRKKRSCFVGSFHVYNCTTEVSHVARKSVKFFKFQLCMHLLIVFVTLTLLLLGDIEDNPGPLTKEAPLLIIDIRKINCDHCSHCFKNNKMVAFLCPYQLNANNVNLMFAFLNVST